MQGSIKIPPNQSFPAQVRATNAGLMICIRFIQLQCLDRDDCNHQIASATQNVTVAPTPSVPDYVPNPVNVTSAQKRVRHVHVTRSLPAEHEKYRLHRAHLRSHTCTPTVLPYVAGVSTVSIITNVQWMTPLTGHCVGG